MNDENQEPKGVTLEADQPERAVLYATLNQRTLGRDAVPLMRAIREGAPIHLSTGTAAFLRDTFTAALDGTGVQGGVLEVASLEAKLIALVGAKDAAESAKPARKARRAAKSVALRQAHNGAAESATKGQAEA